MSADRMVMVHQMMQLGLYFHNWCIRVILLLLEIGDIDIQVLFELFIYDVHRPITVLSPLTITHQRPSFSFYILTSAPLRVSPRVLGFY